MEHRQHILPSTHLTHQLTFDDRSGISRCREPLTDSAGNAQLHSLDCVAQYHDTKAFLTPVERSLYSTPTLPSQPLRQPMANSLGFRRRSIRRRRQQRFNRNPIVDSPQYQAYRERQYRDGNSGGEKWPDVLERAFLDALIEMPKMGRRKYSFKGKPHGRNEMITEYLWIAYKQSLPRGAIPDPAMRRERKQVSSHIQVLKGFFRDHPAFERLFPKDSKDSKEKLEPENGFEDSFKDDPCLRAISEGRLPSKRLDQYEEVNRLFKVNMRPVVFWLILDSSGLPHTKPLRDVQEEDLYNEGRISHKFAVLSPQERPRKSLDSIHNWRRKFPYLHHLSSEGPLNCEIIHMDVSLNLLNAAASDGSWLLSLTLLAIPGRQAADWEWRILTTLSKPEPLYRDPESDPPIVGECLQAEVLSVNDTETQIKITYPANSWANAFACLRSIQTQYEEQLRTQHLRNSQPTIQPPRNYVDQMSMFYEVQSRSGRAGPWATRAIILWTFHEAQNGELNETTWRYLSQDVPPPRRMCMSPSPQPSHQVSAAMAENFHHWAETPMQLSQVPDMLDPFVPGLQTPPYTAGLPCQSPYTAPPTYAFQPQYDLPSENLSFVSNTNTVDSEATLVDTTDPTSGLENFLSNTNVHLDYDHNVPANWHLTACGSFDTDAGWPTYNVTSAAPGWDTHGSHKTAWHHELDHSKGLSWGVDEHSDWANTGMVVASPHRPAKHARHDLRGYVDGNGNLEPVAPNLLPRIDEHGGATSHDRLKSISSSSTGYAEQGRLVELDHIEDGRAANQPLVSQEGGALDVVALKLKRGEQQQQQHWDAVGVGADGFDYAHLAGRLK